MRERTLGINLLQILASEQDVLGVCLELVLPDLVKKKKKKGDYVSVQVRQAFSLLLCLVGSWNYIRSFFLVRSAWGWRWEERSET